MNEEQGERYEIEIDLGRVWLIDNSTGGSVQSFTGPRRLLAATAELWRLRERDELAPYVKPEIMPAEFLGKKLPAVARRQRIEGHLAEVKEIEESLVLVLAEDAANLKRATALREKLEKELETGLSSTETAQNAPGVGQDTLNAAIARSARQVDIAEILKAGTPLFKPQPY